VTNDGRIDPQPVTLDVVPVSMVEDKARREALAAANGRDLVQERVTQVVRFLAVVVALLAVVRLLCGCSPASLAAIGAGASTARDVAKIGCAILSETDGSSADVLAATARVQRQVLEAQAEAAKQRGANREEIDALLRTIAALSRLIEVRALDVVRAAGDGPARMAPCEAGALRAIGGPTDPNAPSP
jgi:hypothetical protein